MARNNDLPELMTVAEAAEALHLADETIHRWVREGRLDYADVLGTKRLFKADIELLVARRNAGDQPAETSATTRGG